MLGVNPEVRNSLQNIESYLLSHENQIKAVGRRINNAVHKSLLIDSDEDADSLSSNRSWADISDVCLYSWYEATALLPETIGSGDTDSKCTKSVCCRDGDEVLAELASNKSVSEFSDGFLIEVESHSLTKLPPLKNLNEPEVDLDKVYIYDDESGVSSLNYKPIHYKQYDFNIKQWVNRPNGYAFSNISSKPNSEVKCLVNSIVKSEPFSVYEECVKFGGWPVPSEDMELGMWVYTSPFVEHCAVDIPTQYVCQVQHMHKKMLKDIELTRIINWCKKYNYKSPDFVNSDEEENEYESKNYVDPDFIDPFPPIERGVKENCKYEMIEVFKHLALSSSSYVAPCTGYYLKMCGSMAEELEATFLRNKMNKLIAQHIRNGDLLTIARNRNGKKRSQSPVFAEKLLRLAKSSVHGFGLFAVENIKKGELIIEYAGILVTDSMSDVLEQAYEKSMGCSTYLFRINDNKVIDATKTGNLARYVNHSCDPNAHTCTLQDEYREPHVGIYASRDILAGEEIFYNYRLSDSLTKKEPCYCGSSNCPGVM